MYVQLVDERVTETRIKYAVTARDQSAHEPLFSLDPTEGLRLFLLGVCRLLYIHRNAAYVAIELSHSP